MINLEILYGVFFVILGICVGSFSNVLIYRLPKKESINFPASHCTKCGHKLKWYHNIPLFSWIFLGGRCAFCKDKISIQYPIVEFLGGMLMFIAYYFEPNILKALILGLCFIILLALSAIDFKYKAVPDSLLYASLVLALCYSIIDFKFDGVIAASVLAFAFFALRFIVSFCLKKEAMGPADIFIAGVIGAILGLRLGFTSIFVAAILTLPAYVIVNKKGYELPFVPFLALGMLIVFCAKTETIWILNYIGGANV